MSTSRASVELSTDELIRCEDIAALVMRLQDLTFAAQLIPDTVTSFEEGAVTEVDQSTFRKHVATPGAGDTAPCVGAPRFILFWNHRGRFFARQLTPAKATRFFQLLIHIVD